MNNSVMVQNFQIEIVYRTSNQTIVAGWLPAARARSIYLHYYPSYSDGLDRLKNCKNFVRVVYK